MNFLIFCQKVENEQINILIGEAEYIDDIPKYPNEAHAAFVLASVGNCELDTIDPSPALVSLGPGLNSPYYASFYFCPI